MSLTMLEEAARTASTRNERKAIQRLIRTIKDLNRRRKLYHPSLPYIDPASLSEALYGFGRYKKARIHTNDLPSLGVAPLTVNIRRLPEAVKEKVLASA